MRTRRVVALILVAFLVGALVNGLVFHSGAGKVGCSYDPLPFGLGHTPVEYWLEVYCGA